MALDFPASPTNGQNFTSPGGAVWTWDSAKWVGSGTGTNLYLPLTGGQISGTPGALGVNVALPASVGAGSVFVSAPITATVTTSIFAHNAYLDSSSTWRYLTTNPATVVNASSGAFYFFNAVSGTAGSIPTWNTRMSIDTYGTTTFYSDADHVVNLTRNQASGSYCWLQFSNTAIRTWLVGVHNNGGFTIYDNTASAYRFTIDISGNISTTGNYLTFAGASPGGANGTTNGPLIYADQNAMVFHLGTGTTPASFLFQNTSGINVLSASTTGIVIPYLSLYYCGDSGGTARGVVYTTATNTLTVGSSSFDLRFFSSINVWTYPAAGGNFVVNTGTGYKPGGGVWTDLSDPRVKRNVADYATGLEAIRQLRPVSYQFNGRGFSVDDGKTHIGLMADEVEGVMPEMMRTFRYNLDPDDAEPTDLKAVEATALIYALVNAVQEMATRLETLESTSND